MDSSRTPLVRPFRALRPASGRADEVAAPPYDVVNTAEARALADGKPNSFFHVSRAEIEFADDVDPYSEAVYETAAANLHRFVRDGILERDREAGFYVYRMVAATHTQTGIALAASVDAYLDGRIRRHEHTRPAKETDRVRQIEAVGAITGPVFLVHRADPELAALTRSLSSGTPDIVAADVDGVRHEVWPVFDTEDVAAVERCFESLGTLYIADGHHRSAAGARVVQARRARHAENGGDIPPDGFLGVSFPHDEVRILDYNRLVRDLNGLDPAALIAALEDTFSVTASATPVRPAATHHYGMYLDGQWYELAPKAAFDTGDPVEALDVRVLDRCVLEPLLGIADPRTDSRIDFVGGTRGPGAIEQRVNSGEMAVGFMLHPTALTQLMAVADAGRIMPPKSTWFDPKLADGLLSLPLD